MTYKLVPYKFEHILPLLEEPQNLGMKEFYVSGNGKMLEEKGGAQTLFIGDEVIACSGVELIWPNRGHNWAVMSEKAFQHPVLFFRAMREFFASYPYKRIEMTIPYHLEHAKRRAKLLGFFEEIPFAKSFLPDGQDCAVYTLIKES